VHWLCLGALLLAGCAAPIGANRVTARQAYSQVEANALRTGKPGPYTVSILHRYDLERLAADRPDEAVRELHEKAVASGDRDVLFGLAELSYTAADRIRHSVKPWDPRDERDYYLGAAVYAWLFLFGEGKEPPPGPFDNRVREACDFYNYSLGLALTERRGTNGTVRLAGGHRQLPVGAIDIELKTSAFQGELEGFYQILMADQFRVHGFSVRNREPGIGAPLICAKPYNPEFQMRLCVPATTLLRGPASLAELAAEHRVCALEVYPSFGTTSVTIGGNSVPLETDLTTFRAYILNQSTIWKLGNLAFLAPGERIRSQLILNQPFVADRIPLVFVHGTFSSPVTWAEMVNTLAADPELRQHYQIWSFVYGSGNPLVKSIADFRATLAAEVQRLDPAGTNTALREMVIIGHSQGGLLTKSTVVETGDKLWRVLSTNRLENLKISDADRAKLRAMTHFEPLPFVKRVVFIATPHRGSYLSGSFVRGLARRFVALPRAMVTRTSDLMRLMEGSETGRFLQGRLPTSLDGMSPKNPVLAVMANIPVVPQVTAHSIIAVQGNGDYHKGKDGLVAYESAHVDYAKSEFIVRSYHTCLDNPATIEEVRRILHEHLDAELPRIMTETPGSERSHQTNIEHP
jgi:pimeloyl-ACP methyl ester carboxylesterase